MYLKLLHIFRVLIVILSLKCIRFSVALKKYNVSLLEMSTCKEYDLTATGYTYRDFFQVHSLDHNAVDSNESLHLKFYVMTTMDAHILLSVNDQPRLYDKVYEIVIGAGANTFSAIRTYMGRRRVATNQDPQLLSALDPTPIEIVQTKDGQLSIYIPGFKKEPILQFIDSAPLNISYVSFSGFGSTLAKWFYDCQFDGYESEMEQEERVLTPRQQLLAKITQNAESKTRPALLNTVNFSFQLHLVSFKQGVAILNTQMNFILFWNDARLKWDPKDFNGIEAIVQTSLEIWIPNLIVLNGVLHRMSRFQPAPELHIFFNGSISMHIANAELNTWCSDNELNWPHEQLKCGLALGLHDFVSNEEGNVQLQYDHMKPLSQVPLNTLSEWKFIEISVANIGNGEMKRFTNKGIIQTMIGDIAIQLKIVRNSSFYKHVFTMPILTGQTLILLSFILRGYRRGALVLVVFVIISLGIMFITRHAPPSYIPSIMLAYQHIMRVATFCYWLHIAILWLETYPPKAKPCSWLMYIINLSLLRLILCMRFTDCSEYVAIQEHPWREVAKMINNISFIVVIIVFINVDTFLLLAA